MRIPRVNFCCCGCSLTTGVKILAILGLVFGILGVFSGIAALFTAPNPAQGVSSIGANVVSVIISGMLFYGAGERRPAFLLPWLVVNALYLVMGLVSLPIILGLGIYFGVSVEDEQKGVYIGIFAASLVGVILSLAISLYLYIVVYSLFMEIKEERESSVPYNATGPQADYRSAEENQPPPYQQKN